MRGVASHLMAMSSHGRSGLRRWAFGSVAERVVRAAPVSVLLVTPRALERAHEEPRYHRILVPLDAATIIEEATPLVASLAAASRASLVFVALGEARRPLEYAVSYMRERGFAPASTAREPDGSESEPARTILEAAEEQSADLIVLCTHLRSSLAPSSLSRAVDVVLRKAPCPVLLVRTQGMSFEGPEGAAQPPTS